MIDRYFEYVENNGYFEQRRRQQSRYWMFETIHEKLRNNFYNYPGMEETLIHLEEEVLSNRLSSFIAARKALEFYGQKHS